MSKFIYILALVFCSFHSFSQEFSKIHNSSFGMHLGEEFNDFRLGADFTTGYFLFKDNYALRIRANLASDNAFAIEESLYGNVFLGLTRASRLKMNLLRTYSDIGLALIVPPGDYKGLDLGAYSLLGFEFFTSDDFAGIIEAGAFVKPQPYQIDNDFGIGFLFNAGWRYYFK